MAKTGGKSIIKQHIEKGVLALSVLVLLWVVVQWPATSPVTIGTAEVAPAEADKHVARQVDSVVDRVARTSPPVRKVPPYKSLLKAWLDSPVASEFSKRSLVEISMPGKAPEVHQIVERPKVALKDVVADIPAPSRPVVKDRADSILQKRDALADAYAAVGVAMIDYGQIFEKWDKRLKPTRIRMNFVVLGVEVEARECTGSADAKSRPVKCEPIPLVGPENKPLAMPEIKDYDGKNMEEILTVIEGFRAFQRYLLQADYPWVYDPVHKGWAEWRIYMPPFELAGELKEAQYLAGSGTPGTPAETPGMRPDGPMPGGMPGGMPDIAPPHMREMGPGGMPGGMPDIAPGDPAMPPSRTPVRPLVRPRPTPAVTPSVPRVVPPPAPGDKLMVATIPDLNTQMENGKVAVWFLDNSLEAGKRYQYRVRLKLLNPLLTWTQDVVDPKDAQQASIDTPWSEWSSEVQAVRENEFFLTGSTKMGAASSVKVTVFARTMGQWVSQTMTLKEGNTIGLPEKKSVDNPLGGAAKPVDSEVDFRTGATIVNLDFNKRFSWGNSPLSTVEMTYVDASGKVCTKLLKVDGDDPRFKELEKLAAPPKPLPKAPGS